MEKEIIPTPSLHAQPTKPVLCDRIRLPVCFGIYWRESKAGRGFVYNPTSRSTLIIDIQVRQWMLCQIYFLKVPKGVPLAESRLPHWFENLSEVDWVSPCSVLRTFAVRHICIICTSSSFLVSASPADIDPGLCFPRLSHQRHQSTCT